MNKGLRDWIASSLLNGYQPKQLRQVLVRTGFSTDDVEKELAFAAPYIKTANKIKKTLNAREGLLKTLDYLARAQPNFLTPQQVTPPPFRTFLEEYYYPNKIGYFRAVLEHCDARHWTPRHLVDKIGADTIVAAQYGYDQDPTARYAQNTAQFTKHIKFGEFIDMVENTGISNSFYITGANYAFNNNAFEKLMQDVQVGDGYFAPVASESTDRRIYPLIGPRGTVSEIHYDFVNNLFIQVYGRKLVRLVPALQTPYMYNETLTHSDVDILNPKAVLYPDFSHASVIEVEVGPGDGLFIPVGWWHHVTSLSPSISLVCTSFNMPDGYKNMFIDESYVLD